MSSAPTRATENPRHIPIADQIQTKVIGTRDGVSLKGALCFDAVAFFHTINLHVYRPATRSRDRGVLGSFVPLSFHISLSFFFLFLFSFPSPSKGIHPEPVKDQPSPAQPGAPQQRDCAEGWRQVHHLRQVFHLSSTSKETKGENDLLAFLCILFFLHVCLFFCHLLLLLFSIFKRGQHLALFHSAHGLQR